MKQLEVFFDYSCPYCLTGHRHLEGLIKEVPQLEILWHPCEAHPRPERYGMHSDLAIRAMFYAQDQGIDMWKFHNKIYHMIHIEHINVEKAELLAEGLRQLLDADALCQVLNSDQYNGELEKANSYAYEQSGVWAVPAYRMEGRKLDSVEDIGVTREQLKRFLHSLTS